MYERVKEIAKRKGLTISQVEKDLGWARSSICKFDKNMPGSKKLKELADYLEVTPAELLYEVDVEKVNKGEEYAEMILMYSKLNDEDKKSVMNILKSLQK